MHRNRDGFALITVVVISAVMLTTVVLISVAAQSARKIQTEQVLSEETLYRAEQALQDTVRELRINTTAAATLIRLGKYDLGPEADVGAGAQRNFHWVKVRYDLRSDSYTFIAAAVRTTVDVLASSLAIVREQNVLSRRIIRAVMKGTGGTNGTPFNYGVYSGGTFSVTGGGVLINPNASGGDVYAAVKVDLNGTPTLQTVEFYSHGTVGLGNPTLVGYPSGTTVASIQHPKIDAVPFPDINQMDAEYQTLFQQFIQHPEAPTMPASPYNGIPGYSSIQTIIDSVLMPKRVTSAVPPYWYATLDDAHNFYEAVKTFPILGLSPEDRTLLLNSMVFYVRNSATDPNAVLGVGVSKDDMKTKVFNMAGTVFCPGEVTANGTTNTIGSEVGSEAFALYCRGDITINGEGEAQGAFLTGGSFKKHGAWTFTGSIAALGDVTCNGGGGMTLTFRDYNSEVVQATVGFTSLAASPSSWSEIDWNSFLNGS